MDKRSFSINFEISMFVYDQGFVTELRDLQQSYIEHADRIELGPWRRRPVHTRLLQNTLQLLAPIL
jgi:cardiolipin synthase